MEMQAICKSFFEEIQEGELCTLPRLTDAQIALIDEVADSLTDEQYVLLHRIFHQLQQLKVLGAQEKQDGFARMVYQYVNGVYLEYYKQMHTPQDYFLLLDKEILAIYNVLMPVKMRLPAATKLYDREGRLLYEEKQHKIIAYDTAGDKLCDTCTDEDGTISGWKKSGNYSGGFTEGMKNGEGVEYYDVAGCQGIRREGIWKEDVFVAGKEYGVLVYKGDAYEIKKDFEGHVLHKDLEYVWDVIMGEGESAKYYFADALLEDGEYTIIEGSIRPAIMQ